MLSRFFLILLFLFCCTTAKAETPQKYSQATLISAHNSLGSEKNLQIALNIKLEKGWKTYWRTPGESGLAPELNWSGSQNLHKAEIKWPKAKRFSVSGIDGFGYEDEITFPINITLKSTTSPLFLKLKLELLICNQICVPATHNLSLNIPVGSATKNIQNYNRIVAAQKTVPSTAKNLKINNVWLDKDGQNGIFLNLTAMTNESFSPQTDIFVETRPYLSFERAYSRYDKTENTLYIKSKLRSGESFEEVTKIFKDPPFTVTIVDTNQAYELQPEFNNQKDVIKEHLPTTPADNKLGFKIIVLAFIGGLILNLMPCVLPVLSLKILSVLKHGGKDHRIHRWSLFKNFMASALGIIFSFWIIAAILIILKAGGHSVGWGIQFQYPPFIIFLIIVLSAFAINLWGWFEVPVPKFILKKSYSIKEREPSLSGHFLTGAFVTLLSTPCSAPFLGTAISFALAGSAVNIIIIFTFLGIGLAFPYIALAISPKLFKHMPKPGEWMATLRKILSLVLLTVVIWLLSVLITIFTHPTLDNGWQKFDESLISPYVENGKTVFVDITAEWCLTCKANKRFVLEQKDLAKKLNSDNIIKMQADWTHKNEDIAKFLKKYDRYGVPFNIIYGPATPEGVILKEILSTEEILKALNKANAK